MALTENQESTRDAMAQAFLSAMESLFPLPEAMSESDKETIRSNWGKLGQAVAAVLPSVMQHVVSNAEIGTVTSEVVGAEATQNNAGHSLLE